MIALLAVGLLGTGELSSPEDVFVSGRLDPSVPYDTFRIPALCRTKQGTLLAFAEGRKSVADQSGNAIVLRRRVKGAKSWEALRTVWSDAPNALNNPCVLATRGGRIWLMVQRYPHGRAEYSTATGYDPAEACFSFLMSSEDDGKTWSAPRDITRSVKLPEEMSCASGPGIGIELARGRHKGRLVFPLNAGAMGAWNVFAVYSDDGGKTWTRGGTAPKAQGTQPNETQVVELADGTLLMNARNQAAGRFRLQCRSQDGGKTWSTMEAVPELVDPVCQGSIVRLDGDLLAFSHPFDTKTRVNGTLHLSRDGGRTWTEKQTLVAGSFAYSCLCPMGKGRLGILFETVDDLGQGREGYRIQYGEVVVQKS